MLRNVIKKFHNLKHLSSLSSKTPCINVLGIETSCDDTGCAVVNSNGEILGESLYSQNAIHVRYGGVNPIIAYQLHRKKIDYVVHEAIRFSGIKNDSIDAIAVTTKPGMWITLQVGVKYANYLSKKLAKPLIPIHHMEAHALVVRLFHNVPFPFIVLLISGGHCLLAVAQDVNNFLLLGDCLDNPPGEILDKAARRMKLKNIPEYAQMAGGRAIELSAQKAKNINLFTFPAPLLRYRDCNFSFSGLKDFLIRQLIRKETEHNIIGDSIIPEINELCYSFQLAIAEHLAHRTKRAILFCEKKNLIPSSTRNIVVSGGVACNDFIFKSIEFIGQQAGYSVLRPPPKLCTDNGIMIAWNGVEKLKQQCQLHCNLDINNVMPVAPLGKSIMNDVLESNIPVQVTRLKKHLMFL